MDFNFTGSSGPVRQINLGGKSGQGTSAGQLAAAARAERAAREQLRKRNVAALLIQSSFRGSRVARAVRQDLAVRFDSLAGELEQRVRSTDDTDARPTQLVEDLVELTRLLTFSLGRTEKRYSEQDARMLARWCQLVTTEVAHAPLLSLGFKSQPQSASPLSTPSTSSPLSSRGLQQPEQWASLVLLICKRLLSLLSLYALTLPSEYTLAYFNVLGLLTSPDAANPLASLTLTRTSRGPTPSTATTSVAEYALDHLLDFDLHHCLQRFILSFPVARKASSAMANAISLSLAPFRVFRGAPAAQGGADPTAAIVVVDDDDISGGKGNGSAVPPRQKAIRSFCVSVMTIPLLANRVPLPSVSELAAAFPFIDITQHMLALGAYISIATGDSALDDNPLHSPYFLANFLTFGAGRLSHLKDGPAVRGYLEALSLAQDALPSQVFLSPEEWKLQAKGGSLSSASALSAAAAGFADTDDDDEPSPDPIQPGAQDVVMSDGTTAASPSMATRTVTQAAASSSSPRIPAYTLPLDAQTNKRLGVLVSESHLSSLLTASARYATSTRQALCSFLCSTLAAWPTSSREKVFNTIMYGFIQQPSARSHGNDSSGGLQAAKGGAGQMVGGFVRELWRGQVRGNALARTLASAKPGTGARETLATLSGCDYVSDWPAFVLLCELYSRCLLTIGDDEFYPPQTTSSSLGAPASTREASTRNPLPLDEVISLSAMLRNVAFAMYWYEGSGLLTNLDARQGAGDPSQIVPRVPGMKLPLLSLRNLLTKLLQQLHARDSRRKFTPDDHWLMLTQLDLQTFIQSVILEERELNSSEASVPAAAGASVGPLAATAAEALGVSSRSPGTGAGAPFSRTNRPGQDGNAQMNPDRSNDNGDHGNSDVPLPIAERLRARRSRMSKLSARNLAFLSPRLGVLNNIPFVIPFDVRVEIFRQFVAIDRHKLGLDYWDYRARHRARVRRGNIAEDGFSQLNRLGPHLKERIEIAFIDQWGMQEAGIDGGGVYKEFLTSLIREAFDTNRGLWKATEAQELYPNPHSYAKSPDQLEWYTFLGRVLGKALYEGILVDIKFASFFLSKWLGKQGYLDDLASLDSLDKELYRGLIYLKNYTGDVETDLALNFTVTDDEFGVSKTTELVRGGSEIPVTRENRLEYIYRVSHYRLTVQIAEQCQAFFQGLSEMIDPRWLRMMNREELRVLVCGTEEPIDVADLRANTVYGGYHERDVAVEYFWEALESFDQPQRKAFLKFVTSSPNPPLLGFGELYPKFSIRNAGTDGSRLPTASTCVNLLKLPEYGDVKTCREKLIYAIQSGAGFDLS